VITGKVTSEFGQPVDQANVYITDMNISVGTNAQGVYTITIAAGRVNNQPMNLRVRAIGYQPGVRPVRITAGSQTQDFALKQDINRLNEVVVTGSLEGTERSKVPFAVGRLTAEDIPVPALDPLTALQGKVAGVRIASTSGQPGSTPEILLRGPTSINASGRSQGPLIVVDGLVMTAGTFTDLGGLDIESVEVVKGAAGASIYGTKAASGVITIKTKRGANQEGVKFNIRSEYGFSDLNSLNWGEPENHHLQLDETGTRFCVQGTANTAPCSRTVNWMNEVMRINNVNADTVRTAQTIQWASVSNSGGELQNVFQSQIWPGQYYNSFAQISTRAPTYLNSIDASGKIVGVRFFVSGSSTDNHGAIKQLTGQQEQRARVNLDYDARSNLLFSVSTLYDKGTTDLHSAAFGTLLRGAPAGTNYLAVDTLGREIVKGGGTGLRGTDNGAAGFLYDSQNSINTRSSTRFLGSINGQYFPAEWVTIEGNFAYDTRARLDNSAAYKGYRTITTSTGTNFGNQSIGNLNRETMNGALTATFRHQLTNDLGGKIQLQGSFDQDKQISNGGSGQQFVVKDVFTLSNTSTNRSVSSSSQLDKDLGMFVGGSADYKGRYIVDGTFRYDGSSRFGAGNRWAPFGRISAVWRISEEPFWKVSSSKISDFRVRASRGSAGNTPSFNAQYETYSCGATGCSLGQAGNSKLKPETTTENEFGTDFTLFNRLGIEITHATSDTKNQILPVPTVSSLGFTTQWQNAGTLSNNTWEVGATLPVVSRRDFSWNMRGTWDRTRTFITDLFFPEFFNSGGTGQGTGSLFLTTSRRDKQDGFQVNQFGTMWGRKFYKGCGDLPSAVQAQCGAGKDFQVNDNGYVVWVGAGHSWKDGITNNLWQTKLPAAQSPWNYPLFFGMPIVDRPLRGQPGEGIGSLHILGTALPSFRATFNNTITYKRFTAYGLLDGTFGNHINNQGEGWGLLDFSSAYFDQASRSVETAKPLGYVWRAGPPEGAGIGGFYDILGPNNYNVEDGSYAKLREVSLTYKIGSLKKIGGDWTIGVVGRNLLTFTHYSGYDPEVGVSGGNSNSGLINQVDAFDFPNLRTFTFNISTRF
jgi:TonB-linked SusC/RagA family outer membrane protein